MTRPPAAPRLLHAHAPAVFSLAQAWLPAPEPGLLPTRVLATFRAGALVVEADLDDGDVFNDATEHNDRTWEKGDVFEVFARRDDASEYVEVHVTPDNVRLHLRFPDPGLAQRIQGIAAVAADPHAIASSASRTARGWRAGVVVPLAAGPGDLLRVSFCRYDAGRGRAPILSSSSPHPVLAFHRPWEWELCRIAP